jgi:hypothetical protein
LWLLTINRNDLNALGAIALEAKENLGVDTLPFWWIKATIMEIAQCINNITTIVAILRQEQAKKGVTQPDYLVNLYTI